MTKDRQNEINRKAHNNMRLDPERLAHHRKRQADYTRLRRRTNPVVRMKAYLASKKSLSSAKENCINMYSNGDACCAWCPQADMDVLCLDHIDESKTKEMTKQLGHRGGQFLYARLRVLQYPPGFQVLCANCNMKKEVLRRKKARMVAA